MAHALQAVDELVTPEEYLAREPLRETKHEYLAGVVYAMSGASDPHNKIAADLMGILYNAFRGQRCQYFGPDMKVRLQLGSNTYFYYPDAMVVCDQGGSGDGWRARPAILFEILSESTRRIDENEKRVLYQQIESLRAYVRIEQARPEVVVDSRSGAGWRAERFAGLDAVVHLAEPALTLRLAELYERLNFPAAS